MRRPSPTTKESEFALRELFFSKTDPRGIIQSGNSVFVRVSKFDASSLIGRPHNIIRHPHMPRCVFKLLWDTITAGKPIYAYVKNMAADGAYYWVMAAVFPVENGYFSIRMKPSSKLFDAVQDIYGKALAAEKEASKSEAMGVGTGVIVKAIQEAGFSSYDDFMVTALTEELASRDTLMAHGEASESDDRGERARKLAQPHSLAKTRSDCLRMVRSYVACFDAMKGFRGVRENLDQSIARMLASFKGLHLISINMSLSAAHIGSQATTIRTIAESFKNMSMEIEHHLNQFAERGVEAAKAIQNATQKIAGARLQVEMTAFFVEEIMLSQIETSREDVMANCRQLLVLSDHSTQDVYASLNEIRQVFSKFYIEAGDLMNSVMGLEIIRQTGKIEATRIAGAEQKIAPFIDEMKRFITAISEPMRQAGSNLSDMVNNIDSILTEVLDVVQQSTVISHTLKLGSAAYLAESHDDVKPSSGVVLEAESDPERQAA